MDLGLAQHNGRDPAWVVSAAHVAHFVWPMLERRNSVTYECRQEVISHHPVLLQLIYNLVDEIYLPVEILGIIVLVQLGRWTYDKLRQVDPVDIGGIFDI
jgi:hypothetical protein